MRHSLRSVAAQHGFTLTEVVIVVGVVGVLASVAYPFFQDSVRKSRRSDAMAALTRLQQIQERFRGSNPAYASAMASMPEASATSPEKHYTLTVDPLPVGKSATTYYEISATAKSASPQFADTKCRKLTMRMDGGNPRTTSFNAAGTEDTTNANRCWPQ